MKDIIVSADSSNAMIAQINLGEQHLIIDESSAETGVDSGPGPYDYILSALGSCTVITLQMYAKRKNWPLERTEVYLHEVKAEPEATTTNGQSSNRRLRIEKKLKLIGNLSPEQIKRLEDISSRCPVQRSLEAGIIIQTILE